MVQPSYSLNNLLISSIQYLLQNNYHFVVFRYPLKNDIFLLVEIENSQNSRFRLQSFDGNNNIVLNGKLYKNQNIKETLTLPFQEIKLTSFSANLNYMNKGEYEEYVSFIIDKIKAGKIDKCVAGRKLRLETSENFNVAETYIRLMMKYPETYRYLASTSLGLWMGATPELLLHQNGNDYFTVALAGTKSVKENRPWTSKEIEEQKLVTDYILKVLKENGVNWIHTSPVFDTRAGHLLHLKTDIQFKDIENLQTALHPTPAVCGFPLERAKAIILEKEGSNRLLYTGFLGLEGSEARYYVNLRCMQIFENYVEIHVGAGITKDSVAENEWLETEAKANTIVKILT